MANGFYDLEKSRTRKTSRIATALGTAVVIAASIFCSSIRCSCEDINAYNQSTQNTYQNIQYSRPANANQSGLEK